MKLVLVALLSLFGGLAIAQQSAPPVLRPPRLINPANSVSGTPLPANYVLGLTLANKDQAPTELSLVVASSTFNGTLLDLKGSMVTFGGTITVEDGGTLLITYSLATEIAVEGPTTQFKTLSAGSSVRVLPDVPIQIIQSPSLSCRLTVSRLPDALPH